MRVVRGEHQGEVGRIDGQADDHRERVGERVVRVRFEDGVRAWIFRSALVPVNDEKEE